MIWSRRNVLSAAIPLSASLAYGSTGLTSLTRTEIDALRNGLRGSLYTPSDPAYDFARRGLGSTAVDDRYPALVVQPVDPHDVARTLAFAQSHGLEISVRSGGHDIFGASTTRTGVVLDLSKMAAVSVDPATAIARAGAGARSSVLTTAAQPHGLAPVVGMSGHVGLGGLTLGGGMGWLAGSHGATVDNLIAAEIVTADGRLVQASTRENPDLFWALRGGGGNFGVATAFTYKLQPVAQVWGGKIGFKTDISRFLRFMRGFLAESPDALDLSVFIPAAPGTVNVAVTFCWSGTQERGEHILAPLRAFSTPVFEKIMPTTFAAFTGTGAGALENLFWRGGEFDGLNNKAIDVIADIFDRPGPESCGISILHYMHGALCRVPMDATPFIRRDGNILYNILAMWGGTPHPRDKEQWVVNVAERLKVVNSEQTYINYLSYEGAKPVVDSYGPHFARLRAIKQTYDPYNVFRNNRNIRA